MLANFFCCYSTERRGATSLGLMDQASIPPKHEIVRHCGRLVVVVRMIIIRIERCPQISCYFSFHEEVGSRVRRYAGTCLACTGPGHYLLSTTHKNIDRHTGTYRDMQKHTETSTDTIYRHAHKRLCTHECMSDCTCMHAFTPPRQTVNLPLTLLWTQ